MAPPGSSVLVDVPSTGQCVVVTSAVLVLLTVNLALAQATDGTVAVDVLEGDGSWSGLVPPPPGMSLWRGTSEGGEVHVSHFSGQSFLIANVVVPVDTQCPSGTFTSSGWSALYVTESCVPCVGVTVTTGSPPGSTGCGVSVALHHPLVRSPGPLLPPGTIAGIAASVACVAAVGVVAVVRRGRQRPLCKVCACPKGCCRHFTSYPKS